MTVARFRWKSWLAWLVTSLLLILYVRAGLLASKAYEFAIKLEPGYSKEFEVYRFVEGPLSMELQFRDGANHRRRPELGDPATQGDWRESGILKFDNPGSAIRIVASVLDAAPVTYEAMPASAHGVALATRTLTSSLSLSPGVYKWPAERNKLQLHQGANVVSINVATVERPLVGEDVELWVKPALGFEAGDAGLSWLWPSLLWPIFFIVQLGWAFALWRAGTGTRPSSVE
ncbi:hypothetical protein AYJ54_23580 [Bradyrhizobium centrolobii]|uniref:Uncharacterized protein n=2 Tax=Bradyrhizobium centrolobii TaxID=1505087 RepID=A0A176YE73_9BRAD|nr:hypothetical protein AYJ54_23580 [Bradyrhizobium centrolobii]